MLGVQWFRGSFEPRWLRPVFESGARVRVLGSTVVQICDVASGRLHANLQSQGMPWDIAAVGLLAEEAGCRFTDWAGNFTAGTSRQVALARHVTRDAGTNPSSYSIDQDPVLGSTVTGSVDLGNTTGHTFAVIFAFDTPFSVTLSGGQTLLALDLGGSGELFAQPTVMGDLAQFSIPIPADVTLAGFEAYSQAIHFGGIVPFALSNAVDFFVGY